MYKMIVEHADDSYEKYFFNTKEEAENFVKTLDYWSVDIWIGVGNFMVEWSERFAFCW